MRVGLFGKILLAFWLVLFLMAQGLWLLYAGPHLLSPSSRNDDRIGPPVLILLAARIETSGPDAARRELQRLPPRLRNRITITPAAGAPPANGRLRVSQDAVGPDGRRYRLLYVAPGGRGLELQPEILWMAAAAGLAFSVLLAIYITRPLLRLRAGLQRLTQGDLDVRLAPAIGRRGDEIADIARDFDAMAERLRQLLTARDRLLNDVSHELRSPLTRLQLAIGLARQDPRRTEDSLARIEREAGRLDALVHELLALARAESAAAEDLAEYFDPLAVVESVVNDASFEAQTSGRRIQLTAPTVDEDRRPSVRGSADLVRRALDNVVRNALRFSPEGGVVQVEAVLGEAPTRWRFLVLDDGAGVEMHPPERLFDPFVRADSSGVGLGLAIAQRAIIAHGGTISAHNRAEGGFAVEIELPAAAQPPV